MNKSLYILLLSFLFLFPVFADERLIQVATFDSGFGGFFTAKAIEKTSSKLIDKYDARFVINHYGDTQNAPYGEKTPEDIAKFAALGISRAFKDGAQKVFIACNTASTQFEAIKKILNQESPGLGERTISIIESSVTKLKIEIDRRLKNKSVVRVAILSTPATLRALAYPRAIALAYGITPPEIPVKNFEQPRWYKEKGETLISASAFLELKLPNHKVVEIYQIAPGNWVDMIEHGAPEEVKLKAVKDDLHFLSPKVTYDVVGEFCTHFPVFDSKIREFTSREKLTNKETTFIKQGPLMANIFKHQMKKELKSNLRKGQLSRVERDQKMKELRPRIFISGKNIEETKALSKTVFPGSSTEVVRKDF